MCLLQYSKILVICFAHSSCRNGSYQMCPHKPHVKQRGHFIASCNKKPGGRRFAGLAMAAVQSHHQEPGKYLPTGPSVGPALFSSCCPQGWRMATVLLGIINTAHKGPAVLYDLIGYLSLFFFKTQDRFPEATCQPSLPLSSASLEPESSKSNGSQDWLILTRTLL